DDIGDAEPLEHFPGHIGGSARNLAVGGDRRIGRLIGDGQTRKALRLQLFELGVVGKTGGRCGEHRAKGNTGDAGQNSKSFHRSRLLWFLSWVDRGGSPRPTWRSDAMARR